MAPGNDPPLKKLMIESMSKNASVANRIYYENPFSLLHSRMYMYGFLGGGAP